MTSRSNMVTRRCVFFFGGYEHATIETQYRRFVRELGRFNHTWNVNSVASVPHPRPEDPATAWTVETTAANWRVQTEYRFCKWDDLIGADFRRPDWIAIPKGVLALLDFLVFALPGYFRTNWRYALFFLYPLLLITAFEAVAILAARRAVDYGLPLPWLLAPVLAIAIIWLLVRWPGDLLHLRYMLNDWIFARDLARNARPDYEARVAALAGLLVEQVQASDADEIVLAGHSLGTVLLFETLAAALAREPALARLGPNIRILTIGSSLLKIGLHPAASRLRSAVLRVAEEPDLFWVDYQALLDVISFYKCDPVKEMQLPTARRPVMRTVRLRMTLSEESYRRFRTNFLRLHRQFVMGNERRCHYDYFMICCGPMPLNLRATMSDRAIASSFGPDAAYIAPTQAEAPDAGRPVTAGSDR